MPFLFKRAHKHTGECRRCSTHSLCSSRLEFQAAARAEIVLPLQHMQTCKTRAERLRDQTNVDLRACANKRHHQNHHRVSQKQRSHLGCSFQPAEGKLVVVGGGGMVRGEGASQRVRMMSVNFRGGCLSCELACEGGWLERDPDCILLNLRKENTEFLRSTGCWPHRQKTTQAQGT